MVLPLLGAIGAVAGVGGLAFAISQIIHPLSIAAGGVAALATFLFVKDLAALNVFSRAWQNLLVDLGIGLAVGVLMYRMFGWLLVAGGVGMSLAVLLLMLSGTAGFVLYLLQVYALQAVGE